MTGAGVVKTIDEKSAQKHKAILDAGFPSELIRKRRRRIISTRWLGLYPQS